SGLSPEPAALRLREQCGEAGVAGAELEDAAVAVDELEAVDDHLVSKTPALPRTSLNFSFSQVLAVLSCFKFASQKAVEARRIRRCMGSSLGRGARRPEKSMWSALVRVRSIAFCLRWSKGIRRSGAVVSLSGLLSLVPVMSKTGMWTGA